MAQTKEGALKASAKKAGISVAEYIHRRDELGLKWCTICKDWHPKDEFGVDSSRGDGRTVNCRKGANTRSRASYQPMPRPFKGRKFVPARDGDKKQARSRVNYFISVGLLPPPNSLPCTDCGHVYERGGKRHEYDHHLGYDAIHHESVEVVCSACHHQRERQREHDDANQDKLG